MSCSLPDKRSKNESIVQVIVQTRVISEIIITSYCYPYHIASNYKMSWHIQPNKYTDPIKVKAVIYDIA